MALGTANTGLIQTQEGQVAFSDAAGLMQDVQGRANTYAGQALCFLVARATAVEPTEALTCIGQVCLEECMLV